MKQVLLCVFGANGAGKSSLLETVADMNSPSTRIVRGSTILKESLGVASYEALESISAQEKKQALLKGMSSLTVEGGSHTTIVDTHLVVPMRSLTTCVVEDMWDERLLELFQGFVYVSAPAATIAQRRRMDTGRPLRAMRATLQVCAEDLQLNAKRWDEISPSMKNKKVIINDQTILVGAQKIMDFLQTLS
jgi:energy-coupling factor transporter ATP-binding protein EcfA2